MPRLLFLLLFIVRGVQTHCVCYYPTQNYSQTWPDFQLGNAYDGPTAACLQNNPCTTLLNAGLGKVIGGYKENYWYDNAIGVINLYNSDAEGKNRTVIMEGITKGDTRTPPPSTGPYVIAEMSFTTAGWYSASLFVFDAAPASTAPPPMTTCHCSYPNQTYDEEIWPVFRLDSAFDGHPAFNNPCIPSAPYMIFLDATTAGAGAVIGNYQEYERDGNVKGLINLYNSDAAGNKGTVIMEGIPVGSTKTPPSSTGPYVLAELNLTTIGTFYATMEVILASTSIALPSTPSTPRPGTNLACSCNYEKVWLDVIFLFDASSATGRQGLDTMWGLVGTMVDFLNVQRTSYVATNYTTRVGIITYGNQATVIKPLGSVNNDDLDNILSLPFNNDPNTNLEAGLQAANAELDGPNSRANAKHVIVVLAASYNSGGVNAPQEVARDFTEDGGILMTFNYVPGHGEATPILQQIASPGYFFSTTLDSTYQDLLNAFCDANCFCTLDYAVYTKSARGSPTQGCYLGAPITTNYRLASNKCSMFNKGFLAFDESSSKNTFLASRLPAGSTFLLGLAFDSNYQQWMWSDGTPLGSYAPWAGGATPNGANGATCVYVNSNGLWEATDCRNGYYYVCEAPACDSVHYCP